MCKKDLTKSGEIVIKWRRSVPVSPTLKSGDTCTPRAHMNAARDCEHIVDGVIFNLHGVLVIFVVRYL